MVVVLDCRGGSSVGLTRHTSLLKRLAVALNQHYPDRLYRLHLLELPLLLRWALHAVTPLLHPTTRAKLVLSSINDPGLPATLAHLSKRCVCSAVAAVLAQQHACCWGGASWGGAVALCSELHQGVHGCTLHKPVHQR